MVIAPPCQEREAAAMRQAHPAPPPTDWYCDREWPKSRALYPGSLAGKLVLEIGCGEAWISWLARCEGAVVIASDIYGDACHPRVPFVLAPKEALPFSDGAFDVVLCGNVLHHGELEAGIREVYRVLKPRGVLVSFQEPCRPEAEAEAAVIERDLQAEYALGVFERRPSGSEWRQAFLSFWRVQWAACAGNILLPGHTFARLSGEDWDTSPGIALVAEK